MTDIFDNKVVCKTCDKEMVRGVLVKNGFKIRALACDKCGQKILHPKDEQEYHKFMNLRGKDYRVKMRLVGNSYTVSIPKEIVSFMQEQEKIMDDMVRLCFDRIGKLSLNFNEGDDEHDSTNVGNHGNKMEEKIR